MLGRSWVTSFMGRVCTLGPMEKNTTVLGSSDNSMDKVNSPMQTAPSIQEDMKTI
jgi:hypothetical protein